MKLFERVLKARGLTGVNREVFLNPKYESSHDPFLLPDMDKAVDRLEKAHESQESITIYGDYDIDGLTATTVLIDAFSSFGFKNVEAFLPNRFIEGYGLTVDAVERIAKTGSTLIVTVDCGSLSENEIRRANELGVDVIVTDHHNVAEVQPPAVAVINPKRLLQDNLDAYEGFILKDFVKSTLITNPQSPAPKLYPFLDLPGVGVAFKLVQALQTRLDGLPNGQEKWLLDLVALGTVCDVVTLRDENRMHVFWGLKVLQQTRRPGLKALMSVADVQPKQVNARALGFGLGPRMNAAGRLDTAQFALDMLIATDGMDALEKAQQLDVMNQERRQTQDKIFKEAIIKADELSDDPVLVVSGKNWSHGIIGIVAAKLLEKYKKPTYVLEEIDETSKGSARSYGSFSAAEAIVFSKDIITKGGGHHMAAGVTLLTERINDFRQKVNEYYRTKNFNPTYEQLLLLPTADTTANFDEITDELIGLLDTLEPFGNGNPQPIVRTDQAIVKSVRRMGADNQHVKMTLVNDGNQMDFLAFNAPQHFFVEPGEIINIWYQPQVNEWQGRRSIEGRLLHLEAA